MFYNNRINAIIRFAGRFVLAALFLLPLYWIATSSLLSLGSPLPTTFNFWPRMPTFENYRLIWSLVPFGQFLLNSLLVVITAVPLTILTSSWAGIAISLLPRQQQRGLILFSLLILMVPGIALWMSRFLLYKWLGILDTRWALIMPAFMGSSPFFVLIFYRSFRRISLPIFEAARLEGASAMTLWYQIGLPQIKPTTAAVGLLAFVLYWGDFISPLLYIRSESGYTVPFALQLLQQMSRSDWPLLMAAAMTTTAVPILLLILARPLLTQKKQ